MKQRNLYGKYSACIFLNAIILSLLFFSCGTLTPVSAPAITEHSFKEVPLTDKRHYVIMKDSAIVYGEKAVGWGMGLGSKKIMHLDGKPIPASEVVGFKNKEGYWAKLENDAVAKRLVAGRLSVYRQLVDIPGGARYTVLFLQKNNGPLIQTNSLASLRQMVSDCPKAYSLINMSDEEYMKILKKQQYYTQTVIETYNNCGEWK